MKLFIPRVGQKLRVLCPWTFRLHNDFVNAELWNGLDLSNDPAYRAELLSAGRIDDELAELERINTRQRTEEQTARIAEIYRIRRGQVFLGANVTLEPGTILTTDRMDIKKGSVSPVIFFMISYSPSPSLTPVNQGGTFASVRRRFWAKLDDVNLLDADPIV